MQKNTKSWYAKWWGILIILFIGIILIIFVASSFYFIDLVKNIRSEQLNIPALSLVTLDEEILKTIEGSKNNYWLGSANPQITIVEFADFACSYCQNSFSKIREISLKYNDNVKIIFRDYPVMSDYSTNLALAARCAGEQGLFWVMHDKLFLNQGISEKDELINLANQIGADINKFTYCFDNRKYLKEIENDFADGKKLEIIGTPTWFINGNKVEGDIPYEIFMQIIEKLIK
jgi:protein-disulfide isomerase